MTNTPLLARLAHQMAPAAQPLFDACVARADALGAPLYLVGGALRDLLRDDHAPLTDLDLALDGDVAPLATAVAAGTEAALRRHEVFGTATLIPPGGGARLDLARTPRERYPSPGALPEVEPAPIAEDLRRRDFTVNALALQLSGDDRGTLLDPFDGRADLAARRIRVLHPASFGDDPTRLIRACRYAGRIGGRLVPATARLVRRDRAGLAGLTAQRFGAAWCLLLDDVASQPALALARKFGLSQARLPGWRIPPRLVAAFKPWPEIAPPPFFWALTGLSTTDAALVRALPPGCDLRRAERRALTDGARLRAERTALARRAARLSGVAARLRPHDPPALAAAALLWGGVAGHRVEAYVDSWQHVEAPLSPSQLVAAGVPSGPRLGACQAALRDAVLDGRLPAEPDPATLERWLQSWRG